MELSDYSGPFKSDLRFADFSKDFLLKLIGVWQRAWLQLDAAWFEELNKRFGTAAAMDCDREMWIRVAERCNPRYAKIAGIPLKNVVDSFKLVQLPLDSTIGEFPSSYDIKNENHAVATVLKCPGLEWCEREAPERIEPMCRINEIQIMRKYYVNPNIKITPLKTPPRRSADEIACSWEYKIDVPPGVTVRGKSEVVDETTDIPELKDNSGPFYPNLRLKNFSKEFLLKLMDAWQYAWVVMAGGFFEVVRERFGFDAASDINRLAWRRLGERANPRYARVANIQLNTVLDSLKCMQLPLGNTVGPLCSVMYDIKDENHVILTVTRCRPLQTYERERPEMIIPVCHQLEQDAISKALINPNIRVTPLRLPPRQGRDQVACQWELKLEPLDKPTV